MRFFPAIKMSEFWDEGNDSKFDDAIANSLILNALNVEYLEQVIKGELKYTISHGKDLDLKKDSSNLVIRISSDFFSMFQTKGKKSPNPIWKESGTLPVEFKREDTANDITVQLFNITNKSETLLGVISHDFESLLKHPGIRFFSLKNQKGVTLINGLYDIETPPEHHPKCIIGKAYLQFKWVPEGLIDNEPKVFINDKI